MTLTNIKQALRAISEVAGNLPDERLTDKTGANDAAARGLMVTQARKIARDVLSDLEDPPKLRVWWIPQIPGEPFYVPVETIDEGRFVLRMLAYYDLFQLSQNVKPDYANVGGLHVYEDGEWVDWYSADGDDIDSIDIEERAWPEDWKSWQ